ncbi:membrane protein [Ralstonia pickettii DTP0602]|nr:membrane protein [Ralstonia pickettii DTP0602]
MGPVPEGRLTRFRGSRQGTQKRVRFRSATAVWSRPRTTIAYHACSLPHSRKAGMRAIGNFLWFILGGVVMGLAWWLAGLLCFISIIGIPWGKACFVIGTFTFFPFGKQAISRRELTGRDDLGTGAMGLVGNVLWFVFAGVWLAIGHVMSAIANFVTIIGIPFAIQHLKLAGIALAPIGQTVVSNEVAEAARRDGARTQVDNLRR